MTMKTIFALVVHLQRAIFNQIEVNITEKI